MKGDSRTETGTAQSLHQHSPSGFHAQFYLPSIFIGLFASAALLYFAWQPLWHTDLWGHLAYGRWMSEHRAIPSTEPFLPWDRESRFIDTAWLSQWIGFQIFRSLGVGGLQWLYAGSIALAAGLLARQISRKSGSVVWGIVGAAIFLALDWEQLKIMRPQLAGLISYMLVLDVVLMPQRRGELVGIALLFAAWANLHASFVIGLAVIALLCLGRIAVLVAGKHGQRLFQDRRLRRDLALFGVAVAATLFNPYGLRLYGEVWRISAHPNLTDLIEWEPLHEHPRQSAMVAAAVAVSIVLLAMAFVRNRSRRGRDFARGLLSASLLAATLWKSRMIVWWGPAAGWMLAMVARSRWPCRNRAFADNSQTQPRNWKPAAIGAAILAAASLFTPGGLALVTGRPVELESAVSDATPTGVAEYFRQHSPAGQIFNPMEWGDYLVWAGPDDLKIFANSHVHLIPPEIWRDYMAVSSGADDTLEILAKHRVEVVAADPGRQVVLFELLRESDAWQTSFEDNRSIVFTKVPTQKK